MSNDKMCETSVYASSRKIQQPPLTFPYKLWELLSVCNDGAIRWSETGDYVIIDQARFSKSSAVNKIFKTIQFSSFVRQLNLYGFRKFFPNHKLPGLCTCRCHSTSSICYQHDNFRRGNFSSLVRVTRPRARRQSKSGFLTIEENVDNFPHDESEHVEQVFQGNDPMEDSQLMWNVATVPIEMLADPKLDYTTPTCFADEALSCYSLQGEAQNGNTECLDGEYNGDSRDSPVKVENINQTFTEMLWTRVATNKTGDYNLSVIESRPTSSSPSVSQATELDNFERTELKIDSSSAYANTVEYMDIDIDVEIELETLEDYYSNISTKKDGEYCK